MSDTATVRNNTPNQLSFDSTLVSDRTVTTFGTSTAIGLTTSTGLVGTLTGIDSSTVTAHPTFTGTATVNSNNGLYVGSSNPKKKQVLSPTLVFKFVKSKFSKLEKDELKKRLSRLYSMLKYSEEMQQWAIYEDTTKELLKIVREQEAAVLGIEKVVQLKDVKKFIDSVRDKVIKYNDLTEFTRIIPKRVRTRLLELRSKRLFDNYTILYIDYTKPEEEIKSNKKLIEEKDPILFGTFDNIPDKLYYIADWEDEYCNLRLSDLVSKLEGLDSEYQVDYIEDITPARIKELQKEVLDRHKRLGDTRTSNYRDLMKEEERLRKQKAATKPTRGVLTVCQKFINFFTNKQN